MKAPARSFADLEVWKNAHSFVLEMYILGSGLAITHLAPQRVNGKGRAAGCGA